MFEIYRNSFSVFQEIFNDVRKFTGVISKQNSSSLDISTYELKLLSYIRQIFFNWRNFKICSESERYLQIHLTRSDQRIQF